MIFRCGGEMKRLCIYVTYDFENIIDDYIGCVLKELRKVIDYLVVVCNYEYIAKGVENVQPYADKIYYRENKGFDAGAYKDVLCRHLSWDEICKYDEMLLVNDSFYGFVYPIENMIHTMKKAGTDYWGITRAPCGKLEDGYWYDTHIQSYFWAFRKNVLKSAWFRQFWSELEYPYTLNQTVKGYELGLNYFLKQHGFKGTALTDMGHLNCIFKEKENPYMLYSLELMRDLKVPIIKRTSFYLTNKGFGNALKALQYIEMHKMYHSELIKKHMFRISQSLQNQGMLNLLSLKKFHEKYKNIYFYGAGVYGHNLALLFDYMGWQFTGFMVTDIKNQTEKCLEFNKVELGDCDAVIISVADKRTCVQILELIKRRYAMDQILSPNFIR
jgi:lipopolysaccharide biosynthesis protein